VFGLTCTDILDLRAHRSIREFPHVFEIGEISGLVVYSREMGEDMAGHSLGW
jgi:hypothetical protein